MITAQLNLLVFLLLTVLCGQNAFAAITVETVTVGFPGNPGEQQFVGVFGAVAYEYGIGIYEVTNSQYAAFLNAIARSDPNQLYNGNMASTHQAGGIARSGSDGNYSYSVNADMGNKPVTWVSFYDALRFANWLNNGQPNGPQTSATTENGAYDLSAINITRNAGATWFLPSENEWYKAAYYQPSVAGGPTDGYWLYPTQSDSTPTVATANSTGDIANPGVNVANYGNGADWNGRDGNVTTVGSAGSASASYFGTFDQGGNVWEWNETGFGPPGFAYGIRGGSFSREADQMSAPINNQFALPTLEDFNLGFRVGTIAIPAASVPEPGSMLIWAGLSLAAITGQRAKHLLRPTRQA